MTNHTYRVTEYLSAPRTREWTMPHPQRCGAGGRDPARGLDWFEVTEVRGHIEDGVIEHFQVGLKVGFRLDAPGVNRARGCASARSWGIPPRPRC